jgi:hypothetical protein
MADVEPQVSEETAGEVAASAERGASHTVHPTGPYGSSGLHGPQRSGITWWEACGGWSSRYSLSI